MADEDAWMDETEEADGDGVANREWNSLAQRFTNDGYREGITAGKESALQSGFDQGFADTGAPVGRQLGNLRGTAAVLLQYLTQLPAQGPVERETGGPSEQLPADMAEMRSITQALGELQFQDVAPRDAEAIAHAREHGIEEDEEDADAQLASAFGSMKTVDGQQRLRELAVRLQVMLARVGL